MVEQLLYFMFLQLNPNAVKNDHSICLAKVSAGAVEYNLLMTAASERCTGKLLQPVR